MSAVARSLVVFGWYLAGFGALLVFVPNLLFGVFGLPPTEEVWIRVAGVLVLIIAYFNVRLGREERRCAKARACHRPPEYRPRNTKPPPAESRSGALSG